MWSDGYWLHDRIVGCVADGSLCEDFEDGIECSQVDFCAAAIDFQVADSINVLDCVFLGSGSPFVPQSSLHGGVMDDDVCCWGEDSFDCAF